MDHATLCSAPSNERQRTKDEGQVTRDAFNPRPRTEGDLPAWRMPVGDSGFQSAPSHGGRRSRARGRRRGQGSFNPRPRTEGDCGTRRADCEDSAFQSAPSHGGRRLRISLPRNPPAFQSAPSHGGRLLGRRILVSAFRVSIRALARRATFVKFVKIWKRQTFQSAPSHGGRPITLTAPLRVPAFQSAPSHGGRPHGLAKRTNLPGFNPRPRTEGDDSTLPNAFGLPVSIRALARRATIEIAASRIACRGFNPRPRTEGDDISKIVTLYPFEAVLASGRGGSCLVVT
jgi:hypothetical protein